MKGFEFRKLCAAAGLAAGIAALSACAPKPEPAPVPPPVVRIPPQPVAPMAAAPNLKTPPLGPDGNRITVNYGVSADQATWNLRSAYNVAALNCQDPEHGELISRYGAFLKTHARALSTANKQLDQKFRQEHGSQYIQEREVFQTQVYNYFALPPVMPAFCDAALAVSLELQAIPAGGLEAYAPHGLARIEQVYRDFFNSYDQYVADLKAWKARYEPTPANIEASPLRIDITTPPPSNQSVVVLPSEGGTSQ